jgi:uncharacterized protein YecE (DUF72 family)
LGTRANFITGSEANTAEERREFVSVARKLAEQAAAAHVMFNNNYQDQSRRNARLLRRLLE